MEVVQLYLQDLTASLVRPVKELKDYRCVALAPDERKTVSFLLPRQEMGFYDNSGRYLLEDGRFRIYVGGSSRDCLMQEINITF